MAGRKKEPGFEESLKRLAEIVDSLEQGEAGLEDSMKLFEEGTALLRRCSSLLDRAEQQVVELRKGADGAPEELPFAPPPEDLSTTALV